MTGGRQAQEWRVPGLENKRGIPHGHQPLRPIPPAAQPVFIHRGEDTQYFPTPEAQLVRSCGRVVTERADCPVGARGRGCDEVRWVPAVPPTVWRVRFGSARGTLMGSRGPSTHRRILGAPALPSSSLLLT